MPGWATTVGGEQLAPTCRSLLAERALHFDYLRIHFLGFCLIGQLILVNAFLAADNA